MGEAFEKMGLKVFTGNGGFYHWMQLPDGMNCDDLNKRLYTRGAAILAGRDCDMGRPHSKDPGYTSPYMNMFRFSFGPLLPETFDSDIQLMTEVLDEYRADVARGAA